MFDFKTLISLDEESLKKFCLNLQNILTNGNHYDLDGIDLFSELKVLKAIMPKENNTAIDILNYINEMNCYPNTSIAYRILLTIPVTVASAERSFSKLKLLKSYLRSTMLQERLNGLAMLSIEEELLSNIDYKEIIKNFALQNVRRLIFQ